MSKLELEPIIADGHCCIGANLVVLSVPTSKISSAPITGFNEDGFVVRVWGMLHNLAKRR